MASFRDTFTRGDKKDFLLNYDDAAFLYFIFVILFCIAVPMFCVLSKKALCGLCGWNSVPLKYKCKCQQCTNAVDKCVKQNKTSWFTCGWVIQVSNFL